MSQAVVDVLVRVNQLIDGVKARNAFVITKGVNGVFRSGDNPLNNDSPFIEEPEAIELMKEILSGIEVIMDRRKDVFDLFKNLSAKMMHVYDLLMRNITDFISNPDDQTLLYRILASKDLMSFTLYEFQTNLHHLCDTHRDSAIALCSIHCFENAADDDLTWGFEAACEVVSALLAMQRVAIEVLRRAMTKGCVYEGEGKLFGVKRTVEYSRSYKPDHIAKEELGLFKEVDKCVWRLFNVANEYWKDNMGQIHKLTAINLGDSPPTAVSHNGELYWVSAEGKLQKFVNGTHREVGTAAMHMHPLASHNGKLHGVSKLGGLYELDPDSGKTTLVIEQLLFSKCASMVSLGDYLYITRSTYFYNFYKVDPMNKSFQCLGNDWNGARLTVKAMVTKALFARYNGYFFGGIYSIYDLSTAKPSYRLKSGEWIAARVPNIVSHGAFLYTHGWNGDLFMTVDRYDYKTLNITRKHKRRPSTQIIPLVSHSMSLVCQHFNDWRFLPYRERNCYMAIVRPFWTSPPNNWFEDLMSDN